MWAEAQEDISLSAEGPTAESGRCRLAATDNYLLGMQMQLYYSSTGVRPATRKDKALRQQQVQSTSRRSRLASKAFEANSNGTIMPLA